MILYHIVTAQHLDTDTVHQLYHTSLVLYNKYSVLVRTIWDFVISVLGSFIIYLMYIGIYAVLFMVQILFEYQNSICNSGQSEEPFCSSPFRCTSGNYIGTDAFLNMY